MRPEIAVLDIQGQYRVYTEFYRADAAAKTIVLVNGSMATTASFAQTVKSLHPHVQRGVVRPALRWPLQNPQPPRADADQGSRGPDPPGTASTTSPPNTCCPSPGAAPPPSSPSPSDPRRVEKAVISSFSPVINAPDARLPRARRRLPRQPRPRPRRPPGQQHHRQAPAVAVQTLQLTATSAAWPQHEYGQMHFHISHVLNSDRQCYLKAARQIDIPVLFLNGEWDEYTSAQTTPSCLASMWPRAASAPFRRPGHFLDMEHKAACRDSREAVGGLLEDRSSGPQARCGTTRQGQAACVCRMGALWAGRISQGGEQAHDRPLARKTHNFRRKTSNPAEHIWYKVSRSERV
jgi:rhamnosyltransferase subunit A